MWGVGKKICGGGGGEGDVYLALKSTTNDVTYDFLCMLLEADPSREICTYTTWVRASFAKYTPW